jgi:cytochrome c-type biogenesis protein
MSLLPEIPNPYVGALAIGLLYGSVFCTSTCLPYIASYIAGVGADFRKGIIITLIYSAGRVVAYALIGFLIGILGGMFQFVLSESSFSSFQQYASYGFGIVTIIIGLSMFWNRESTPHKCNQECKKSIETEETKKRFDLRAFSLGFSRGLIVCPYLIAILLLYSLQLSSPIESFAVAVLFGLGTAISPMILLGGLTGWLLNKAPLLRKWISTIGSGTLILLGAITLVNTFFFLNA